MGKIARYHWIVDTRFSYKTNDSPPRVFHAKASFTALQRSLGDRAKKKERKNLLTRRRMQVPGEYRVFFWPFAAYLSQ